MCDISERRVYKARHERVRHARGSASMQLCEHCGDHATDWATIHGHDGFDPFSDYIALCKQCHADYDDRSSQTKAGIALSGEDRTQRRHSPEAKERMSDAQKKSWENREMTQFQKQRLIEANRARRGWKMSDESRRKLSEIRKGQPQSSQHRAARNEAIKKYWAINPPATMELARRRWAKAHGSARKYDCILCGNSACDWVQDNEEFIPFCRSCNMKRR